ncbi:MAG: 23S rRNA (adenine(2503)-C(2))-methyltransferase RlmN [Myxococcota bacterium]|nr:23S rRNA (adenine(2503)-C(2))-methyltransferase RlmN [Myxococcota bacterium]
MSEDTRQELRGLSYPDLEAWVIAELGEKRFRAHQISMWMHGRYVRSFEEMTDISKKLRERLERVARIDNLRLDQRHIASDGTRKYRFEALGGEMIESVFIPAASSDKRNALCVSSQVGCAMGCTFCLTGRSGLIRSLSPAEIIGQVSEVARDVAKDDLRITNIVFMGMGEPLHNLKGVLPTINLLCHDSAFGLSTRRVTVSTSGLLPGLKKLAEAAEPIQIAVSLNASNDKTRNDIMPVNKRWNIAALMKACREFPLAARRRITFEYVLMKGVNDSRENAYELAKLVAPVRSMVNLIPFNPHPGSRYVRGTRDEAEAFQNILRAKGIQCYIRHTRGDEVLAACGTLSDVNYVAPESDQDRQVRDAALEAIDAI